MKKFIAVAGNIGVGKSTLVDLLCARFGWKPFFEPSSENPYLADFYKNMERWAFHSQIYFLTHRLKIHQQITSQPESVIQDRSIYEDAEIFAHNLYLNGSITQRDYETYLNLYHVLTELLPPPDLVIYLRAEVPTLIKRIKIRNRAYEQSISPTYLEQLNVLYESWIHHFTLCPVLTVPSDRLDYVTNLKHFELIALKIEEKLQGKEEVIFAPDELI